MANVNLTQITPPRVPIVDARTGLVSREWYRFFLNLFELTGGGQNTVSLTDLQKIPTPASVEDLQALTVELDALKQLPVSVTQDDIASLVAAVEDLKRNSDGTVWSELASIRTQLQSLTVEPLVEVGTMAYLQQVITSLANGDLLQYDQTTFQWVNRSPSTIIAAIATAPVTNAANFTVGASDKWIINNKSGSTCTATLPAAASYTGRELNFQNYQAQLLISASSNVVPLAGGAAGTAILAAIAGDTATLVSDGTNWLTMKYTPNNVMLLD